MKGTGDVLIRGMEMPKPGQIVLVEIDENGDVFAAYDGGRTKLTQHKAVPVPPHGDLIDQDEYRDEFMDGVYELCSDDSDNYRANAIIDLFDEAPTIIPAEPFNNLSKPCKEDEP